MQQRICAEHVLIVGVLLFQEPPSGEQDSEEQHVFLYNKLHIRAGAAIPPPETLPPITIAGMLRS
jgi:hypothetical protein